MATQVSLYKLDSVHGAHSSYPQEDFYVTIAIPSASRFEYLLESHPICMYTIKYQRRIVNHQIQ